MFDGETVHMWGRYGKGVVVMSRFELLKAQLSPMLDKILIGTVKYDESDHQGYNLIQFLFTKRRAYEKEKELRVVLQSFDPVAGMNRQYNDLNFPSREPLDNLNPLHRWVHPFKRRRIDLKSLVAEIRLSPWATKEEFDEVNTWVKNKSFTCQVIASDLTSALTPTLNELNKL